MFDSIGKTKRQATVGLKSKLRKNETGEGELTGQPKNFPLKDSYALRSKWCLWAP